MYAALLTRRYMTSKIMPLLAAGAVMLCTAMVLVTWSVMGGFLNVLLSSGRALMGDVEINWPNTGLAYSDELIERLKHEPQIRAAAPMIDTFGLVSLPDDRVEAVSIKGIEPVSYAQVVDYQTTLWWKPIETPLRKDTQRLDPRLSAEKREELASVLARGLSLSVPDPKTGRPIPACVPGIELTGLSKRQPEGIYLPQAVGKAFTGGVEMVRDLAYKQRLTIRVAPMDSKGRAIELAARTLPIANEFRTGVFDLDKRVVLVELGALQRLMKMDEARRLVEPPGDPYDRRASEPRWVIDPARVTTVLVSGAEGTTPEQVRAICERVYDEFARAHQGQVPSGELMSMNGFIRTWEMKQAGFVSAVRNETALVLFLLGFISIVASVLILAIFWAMISEKTRDIGVLRAIGASRTGVAWVWVRYGLLIGIAGSLAGGVLAYSVVTNINPIHEWMGRALHIQIWNPRVYYFTEIPNQVDPVRACIVLTGGLIFSLIGAIVPAVRAAWMDPVRALRFE